jgi:NitT/TauT family transport system substrate-binding protein
MLRRAVWASMAVLALAAAVACGGGPAGPQPLRVGVSDWPGWVAWYIAQEQGLFDKYGLKVRLVWFPVYSDSIAALSAGQLDANSQTWNDTMPAIAKGVDLKLVLVNDNSAGNDAIVARQGITSLAQLRGRTVALEQFTVSHLFLYYMLRRNGIDPKEVEVRNMTVGDAAAAFLAGSVDAATLWNPWIIRIQQEGRGNVLATSADAPGLIPDALVVRGEVLRSRRDELVKLVRVWAEVVDFIRRDPQAAARIMAPKVDIDPQDYLPFLKGTRFFGLEENLEAFTPDEGMKSLYGSGEFIQSFLLEHGLLDRRIDVASALDGSLVREAMRGDGQ